MYNCQGKICSSDILNEYLADFRCLVQVQLPSRINQGHKVSEIGQAMLGCGGCSLRLSQY